MQKTAEIFSVVLDPEKPLKFDENLDYKSDDEPLLAEPIEEPPEQEARKEARKPEDPDEVVSLDGDAVTRSSNAEAEEESDGSDDLKPYNLEDDDSDLYPDRKQLYL